MSKVAVVSDGYAPAVAGAELMAWGTARELAARGHQVAMIARINDVGDRSAAGLPITAGVTVLDWRAVRDDQAELPWAPDLVHAFDLGRPQPHAFAAELAARSAVPFILTPATHEDAWPAPELAAEALYAADAVFALTRAEAEGLVSRIRSEVLLEVIGQAADRPTPTRPQELRRDLDLDGPVVLFLGRRRPSKGFAELAAAAELVRKRSPEVCFVFAGPGEGRLSAPDVTDLGMVAADVKADLLGLCDVLCLPSRSDVFPLVFIEAWFLGKPVISGNFTGAAEVIREGTDGLIVQVDPVPIAEAVLQLADDSDRRVAMGLAGKRRAERDLTWPFLIGRIQD